MLIGQFIRQAEAVGAECRLVEDRRAAVESILSVLREEGAADEPGRLAVWAGDGFLIEREREELARRFPALHFDVTREAAARALIGISEMDWGAAQTGTLVSDSSAVARRLVSTLPPIHVALLYVDRIVGDMAAALGRLDPRQCAFVAAITGPSRTADIERVLTIGVHGPRRLLILIIQNRSDGKAQQ